MKLLIIFSSILFLMSCGNNPADSGKTTPEGITPKPAVVDPDAAKGLTLVAKSDCFTCHKLNESSIGPSYAAIATKYKTITTESMDSMVLQISKGGSGRWGYVPMPPHPAVSKEDAELMVHYIMSIK